MALVEQLRDLHNKPDRTVDEQDRYIGLTRYIIGGWACTVENMHDAVSDYLRRHDNHGYVIQNPSMGFQDDK